MIERELLPLSLLSQYSYCPRRCGMLLIDRVWKESADTVSGTNGHDTVHESAVERRKNNLKLFNYAVISEKLGIHGYCDCIEGIASEAEYDTTIPGFESGWKLYPIEYKHGVVRNEPEYNIQLCAQAMCLEEMFGVTIEEGAVFYINSHRRTPVAFDARLRDEVVGTSEKIREIYLTCQLPPARKTPKCRKCSMLDLCIPEIRENTSAYLDALIDTATGRVDDMGV